MYGCQIAIKSRLWISYLNLFRGTVFQLSALQMVFVWYFIFNFSLITFIGYMGSQICLSALSKIKECVFTVMWIRNLSLSGENNNMTLVIHNPYCLEITGQKVEVATYFFINMEKIVWIWNFFFFYFDNIFSLFTLPEVVVRYFTSVLKKYILQKDWYLAFLETVN